MASDIKQKLQETFCVSCHSSTKVNCYAPVAQGIEQWFPKPCVGGSNPLRCTPHLTIKYGIDTDTDIEI